MKYAIEIKKSKLGWKFSTSLNENLVYQDDTHYKSRHDAVQAYYGKLKEYLGDIAAMSSDLTIIYNTPETFDFGNGPVPAHQHKDGGGWVANTAHVDDTVYIGPNARVYDYAKVLNGAKIFNNAHIYGNAKVFEIAKVFDRVRVFGDAMIYGDVRLHGQISIHDSTNLHNGFLFGGDLDDSN